MTWRDILAGGDFETKATGHNGHNSPKKAKTGNCGHYVHSVHANGKRKTHPQMAANDPGGYRLSDPEALAAITETAQRHDIDPDTLASAYCLFDGVLVLWTVSPTKRTDTVSTGVLSLFPDLAGLETVAYLLQRDGKPDTAGDPVDLHAARVRCDA